MIVSSTEPRSFHHLGKLSTAPERYAVDFLWVACGQTWGVQRKTWADLFSSARDGRLGDGWKSDRLHRKVLVLEGRPHVTTEGAVVVGREEWSGAQIRGLLWSFRARGWWVERTTDTLDTAEMLVQLEAWSRKREHLTLDTRVKGKGPMGLELSQRGWGLFLLQSFPGVGPKTAGAIYDRLGVPLRWTVGVGELRGVEGVGKVTAERLVRALGGDDAEAEAD